MVDFKIRNTVLSWLTMKYIPPQKNSDPLQKKKIAQKECYNTPHR